MGYVTDRDVVFRLIKASPGYQVAWYAWLLGGGIIREGEPVGTMVVDFKRFHKVLKVQQRISELVREGKVEMRTARGKTKTPGHGAWPTGTQRPIIEKPVVKSKPVVNTESAKKNFTELRGMLSVKE